MKTHFNFEVTLVSLVALFMLVSTNVRAGVEDGLQHAVYKTSSLHHAPNEFIKASNRNYYRNGYKRYRSKRNYNRSNRYYRGGNSYYRGKRYNNYGNRYYNPRNSYYYRNRYGH